MPRISGDSGCGGESAGAKHDENHGAEMQPVEAHTRATAIRIGNPASWRKAVRVIQDTDGWCLDVTEAEIAIAKAELGREGLGCEPSIRSDLGRAEEAACTREIASNETVVLLLTGHHAEGRRLHDRLPSRDAAGQKKRKWVSRRRLMRCAADAVAVEATPAAVLATLKGRAG